MDDVLDAALVLLAMDGDLLSTSDGSDLASLVRFPAFTSTSLPFKNLTEQNLAKIGLWSEAGRCAAGEHPASAARGPETANPPVGADVIHYSIDAALVCEFPDLPNPQNDVGCKSSVDLQDLAPMSRYPNVDLFEAQGDAENLEGVASSATHEVDMISSQSRGMFALTAPVGDIFRAKKEEAYQKGDGRWPV